MRQLLRNSPPPSSRWAPTPPPTTNCTTRRRLGKPGKCRPQPNSPPAKRQQRPAAIHTQRQPNSSTSTWPTAVEFHREVPLLPVSSPWPAPVPIRRPSGQPNSAISGIRRRPSRRRAASTHIRIHQCREEEESWFNNNIPIFDILIISII